MKAITSFLNYFSHNERKTLVWISLVLLVVKVVLLPFAATVDADAVSRVLMAEKWLTEDNIIPYGVWAPLHLYLNSFIIFLTDDRVWSPVVVNIVFSCFTIFPLYYFTKNIFSEKGSIFSTLLFVLSPVVFRNSFLALSMTPYVFFVITSFYFLSKALQTGFIKNFVFAGVSITIASGFRYEAWVLIAVCTFIVLVYKKWKGLIFFWLSAMIFPLIWMAIGYLYHDDILFGVSGAYHWNVELLGVNENLDVVDRITRIVFFPLSWVVICSPFIAVAIFYTAYKCIRFKKISKGQLLWVIPFLVLFGMFISKSYTGTLLMQHRFSISLLLLSAPFFSLFFEGRKYQLKATSMLVLILTMIPMSFVWNKVHIYHGIFFNEELKKAMEEIQLSEFNQTEAFPYFKDDWVYEWEELITQNANENDGLILDFVSWSSTYYWALRSGVSEKGIFFHAGTPNEEIRFDVLNEVMTKQPSGLIMLFCLSKHQEYYDFNGSVLSIKGSGNKFDLQLVKSKDGISLYRYSLHAAESDAYAEISDCMNCPAQGSKERIEMELRYNDYLMASIRFKAMLKRVTVEEMIDIDVQYILDRQ